MVVGRKGAQEKGTPFPALRAVGRRHIRVGRCEPRNALYMAALCAIRWNDPLRVSHQRLRGRCKKHKVALVAVMRKLIVRADTLLREDRLWAPSIGAVRHWHERIDNPRLHSGRGGITLDVQHGCSFLIGTTLHSRCIPHWETLSGAGGACAIVTTAIRRQI